MKDEFPKPPIVLRERVHAHEAHAAKLVVDWEYRQRSRFRSRLDDGREVAVMLNQSGALADGDHLLSDTGEIIEVRAAAETVSEAHSQDRILFARACYHMGNRHVPLQIVDDRLRFKPDHVLEEMLRQLGLEISCLESPFDPERGAYGAHSHGSAHSSSDDDGARVAREGRGPRIHLMDPRETTEPSGG